MIMLDNPENILKERAKLIGKFFDERSRSEMKKYFQDHLGIPAAGAEILRF